MTPPIRHLRGERAGNIANRARKDDGLPLTSRGIVMRLISSLEVCTSKPPTSLDGKHRSQCFHAQSPMTGYVQRLTLYAVIWWILTGGAAESWVWGLAAILFAALFNPWARTTALAWHPQGVLAFVPVFVALSLRGALDVAWRALHPRRALAPTLIDYPWTLPPGRGRVFLANLINLMPGTLCVKITEQCMTVHILSRPARILSDLQRLERVVARMFIRAEALSSHD